jgi:hypothetical protein
MKRAGAILQLETAFNKGNAIGYKIKKGYCFKNRFK